MYNYCGLSRYLPFNPGTPSPTNSLTQTSISSSNPKSRQFYSTTSTCWSQGINVQNVYSPALSVFIQTLVILRGTTERLSIHKKSEGPVAFRTLDCSPTFEGYWQVHTLGLRSVPSPPTQLYTQHNYSSLQNTGLRHLCLFAPSLVGTSRSNNPHLSRTWNIKPITHGHACRTRKRKQYT